MIWSMIYRFRFNFNRKTLFKKSGKFASFLFLLYRIHIHGWEMLHAASTRGSGWRTTIILCNL